MKLMKTVGTFCGMFLVMYVLVTLVTAPLGINAGVAFLATVAGAVWATRRMTRKAEQQV